MATDEELYQQYLKETQGGSSVSAGGESQTDEELYQQYLKETGAEVPTSPAFIENISHPDVPSRVRLIYKNFGASPEASLEYLKKKLPALQIERDQKGEILLKKPEEQTWKRLDPTGFQIKDIPQDIGDVLYDVPAGAAQGIATALSGLLAGPAALPAAVATSGATGAGFEALRQKLGEKAGIEDNLSTEDIALSGALGAVSPLMFGTGVGAKEATKQAFKNIGKTASKEALEAETARVLGQQRGLVRRAYDPIASKLAPEVARFFGGYQPDTLRAAAKNLPLIREARNNPEAAATLLEEGKDKIIGGIRTALAESGKEIQHTIQKLDKEGPAIFTHNILKPIRDLQKNLATTGIRSEERLALIQNLEDMVQKNFASATTGDIPAVVDASTANEMYFSLKALSEEAGAKLKDIGTTKGTVSAGSMSDKRVARALIASAKETKKQIEHLASTRDPVLADQYKRANAAYSSFKDFQDLFYKATKDEEAYNRFLNKNTASAKYAKQKVSQLIGEDVNELGATMQAVQLFSDPGWQIPAFGTSNTGRTVGAASIGSGLGYLAGKESGEEGYPVIETLIGGALGAGAISPKAIKKYMQINQAVKNIPNLPLYKTYPYVMLNPLLNNQGE